jgi:hypothetical protein
MANDRIYCSKCGAENEVGSSFCKECGADLHAASAEKPSNWWYLLPILFGILGGIIGYIVIKVKDEKMAKNILYVGLGTFVLGIIFIAAVPSPPPVDTEVPISTPTPVAVTPTVTQTPSPTPSEPLITKTPSEIALTINDLPEGWLRREKDSYKDEHYLVTFSREMFGTDYLDCEVTKYRNISDAKIAFKSEKEYYAGKIKIRSLDSGDEGFEWNYHHECGALFRKANIIVGMYFESQYGTPELKHIKKYVGIVEKKIV